MKNSICFLSHRLFFLSLMLVGVLISPAISAQSYSLRVAGISVDSHNCNNITGPGIYGKVQFNPETRVLKLTDATINATNDHGIYPRNMDDFTVELEGTNIINLIQDDDFFYEGILSYKLPMTITGEGTLLTNARITMYGADLTIGGGCKVTAKSINQDTYYGDGKILTIGGANTEVRAPVQGFADMKMNDGIKIILPWQGRYDTTNEMLVDREGKYASVVYISKDDRTDRSLSLGGTAIVNLDWTDNYNIPVDEGTATYNPYSRTLTLNDVNIRMTGEKKYGLCNWDPNYSISENGLVLNMVVNGTCRIWCEDVAMMFRKGITTITGDGKLILMSDDKSAVKMADQTVLNIIDTEVSCETQGEAAIKGEWWMNAEIVNVIHSALTAYSPTYTTDQISDFNLLKCRFQDVGGLKGEYFGFDATQGGSITYNGGAHKGYAIIKPYELYRYSIYLGAVEVTSDNQDDPTGDGTFSFDPVTGTLSMFKNFNDDIQTYYDDPLTLRVEKNVTMTYYINAYNKGLTITGPGQLTINWYIGTDAPLAFINADVEVADKVLGRNNKSKLEVKFSRLKAAEISGFEGGITLTGCYISSPRGARVENGAIVNASGNVITTGVTIERRKVERGDVNGDGAIDVADIAEVIRVMAGSAVNPYADVNGDGTVDVADISEVITIMAHL